VIDDPFFAHVGAADAAGGRQHVVADEGHGDEVAGRAALFGGEAHHLDGVGVEGGDLDLTGVGGPPISAAAGREPDGFSAGGEELLSDEDGASIVGDFGRAQFRHVVEVFLAVYREEISSAREGYHDGIFSNTVARHEDELAGEIFREAAHDGEEGVDGVGVGLRLMVGEEDDVMALLQPRVSFPEVILTD